MNRFYEQTFTIPANTPKAAPVDIAWALEDNTLRKVSITIPDGHNGLTGIRVKWSNQQIIPWGNLSFIVANNRTIDVEFDDYITITGLVIEGFNTDVFPHSFYLEATISDLPSSGQIAATNGASSAVLPAVAPVSPDPLSPDALLASLPADVAATILAGTVA
jgi:hypothetical protein